LWRLTTEREQNNRERRQSGKQSGGASFSMLGKQPLDSFDLDNTNIEIHQWGCKPCFGGFYYGKRGFLERKVLVINGLKRIIT
jgi:hypothetical protein